MRSITWSIWIPVVFACSLAGQTAPEPSARVLHFVHTESPRALQEIANAVRAMGDIQHVSVESEAKSLAVSGSAAQVGLAEWLVQELDADQTSGQGRPAAAYAFSAVPGNGAVRVFYLDAANTPQTLQETVNAIRSLLDVQRVMVYNSLRALVARGTADQMTAADWLAGKLDRAGGAAGEPSAILSAGPFAARVFYLPAGTPQDAQELVNVVRSTADVQRAVFCSRPRALAMRGTAEQAMLAAWLIDRMSAGAGGSAYQGVVETGERVQVLAVPVSSAEALQEIVAEIRSQTGMRRVTPYSRARAVAVRGTAGQIAQAVELIRSKG